MGTDSGPRRFLIATVTARYRNEPRWDLPGLVESQQQIIDLFTGRFGYELVDSPGLNPTQQQLTSQLRAFCNSPERREDDLIAVYLAGHGEVLEAHEGGGHVLLTHDSDPDDVADALPTETLARKMLTGTSVRRLLLMLDTCYSAHGGGEATAAALQRMSHRWSTGNNSGLVIMSSAQPLEQAQTGAFPDRLSEAVRSLATAGYAPATLALDAVVQRMNTAAGHQHISLNQVGLSGEVPAFLPNPRHDARLNEVDLAVQQEALWQAQAQRRDTEMTSRLLVRAMGHSGEGTGWWFAGRTTALNDITAWLEEPSDAERARAALAVTAGPGSGKTAVLGLLATLAHSELRRTVPVQTLGLPSRTPTAAILIDESIYAQNLTDQQVLDGLTAAAKVSAATVGELLEALDGRDRPLTVLIDGLDEALTPETLCAGLLRPLIDKAAGRIRLLLGTRPHLLERLGLDRQAQIDLDADTYADPDAVLTYTVRNLKQGNPSSPYHTCSILLVQRVAAAVAKAAGRSFLVARLVASTLASLATLPDPDDAAWRQSLPEHADEAMAADLQVRLGADALRAVDLLRPLAYAQGQGLPWEDLWADIASATSGHAYTDEDITWLRSKAGSYIVEAVEGDRSAYRLYHQALAEHLRNGIDDTTLHTAVVQVLTDHVPYGADGAPDWSRAHPYTKHYLAIHAAKAQALDEVLSMPEFLVHADPDGLAPHLHAARSWPAQLSAAVYRSSFGLHRGTTPEHRRQVLALDAARYNDTPLCQALTSRAQHQTWIPTYASGSSVTPALRYTLTGHSQPVTAVACTTLSRRYVAVTGSADGTVRLWDLTSGQSLGQPVAGNGATVTSLVCFTQGRQSLVMVAGARDHAVRTWDLASGRPFGKPMVGHTDTVTSVTCMKRDGKVIAVTGSKDRTVRLWDVVTGEPIDKPFISRAGGAILSVTYTTVGRKTLIVSGSQNGTVQVWEAATGKSYGRPLTDHASGITSVACTDIGSRTVVVTGSSDRTVRAWYLDSGAPYGLPITVGQAVSSVACTSLNGSPSVVIGSDSSVQVRDLTTGQLKTRPLAGHTSSVLSVTCSLVNGKPLAVTGSRDHSARVWDLTAGQHLLAKPLTAHKSEISSLALTSAQGSLVAVSGSHDKTVRIWDVATGLPRKEPVLTSAGPVMALASTAVDGTHLVVLGDRNGAVLIRDAGAPDGAVKFWDRSSLFCHHPAAQHGFAVTSMDCVTIEGRPMAVTASFDKTLRIWDLASGQEHGKPISGFDTAITALACTTRNGHPIAVTGQGSGVRMWDLISREEIGSPFHGHAFRVTAIACADIDGRAIAVSGSIDSTARVWDLASGLQRGAPLAEHTDTVTSVACTVVDGRPTAITGSADATVRLWDLISMKQTAVLDLPAPCTSVAAQGELIMAAFGDDIALFTRLDQPMLQ